MADRRGVRASSRRKIPTPQPPSTATAAQTGRASRTRGARSASRDVEHAVDTLKPTRRSTRQASVTSVTDSDDQGKATRKAQWQSAKEALGGQSVLCDFVPLPNPRVWLYMTDNHLQYMLAKLISTLQTLIRLSRWTP